MSKDSGLIAVGKITKSEVFDMKFVPGDWQIVLACMKEIYLVQWKDNKLLAEKTVWKEQKP